MLQITPQMRVLVAVEPIDGRKGIDSLVQLCRQQLSEDPFSGCLFIFRFRSGTSIKLLCFDGMGFWLAQKRLSQGRFNCWPQGDAAAYSLEAHQAQILLAAGNPAVAGAPVWRSVKPVTNAPKPMLTKNKTTLTSC
jgi:transposase